MMQEADLNNTPVTYSYDPYVWEVSILKDAKESEAADNVDYDRPVL